MSTTQTQSNEMREGNRATHAGTCQVCGRTHKVKVQTGLLAAHGYSVSFGQFHGECRGTGEEPFEVSCDLVKWSIESARAQIETQSRKLDALKRGEGVLMYQFEAGIGRNKYHVFLACRVEKSQGRGIDIVSVVGEHRRNINSFSSVDEGEKYVRTLSIRHYENDIKALREYERTQCHRLDNWAPCELKRVTDLEQNAKTQRALDKERRAQEMATRARNAKIREAWSDLAWAMWYPKNVADPDERRVAMWKNDETRLVRFLCDELEMSQGDVIAEGTRKMKHL